MAEFKIRMPGNINNPNQNNNQKPNQVRSEQQPNLSTPNAQNKPQNQFKNQQGQMGGQMRELDSRTISAIIAAAKSNNELAGRLTSMIMRSLNVQKFRERVLEEAMKDPELRNKILLELIRKL